MGITGLYGKLLPYGTPVSWYASPPASNGMLTIDGPAFVHWIYDRCFKATGRGLPLARSFQAIPSYEDLADQALLCLDYFERCGLHVYSDCPKKVTSYALC